jgi:branched-chain amino acid transport system permease protein
VAFGIVLLVLPFFIPSFVENLVAQVMIFAIFAVSMNVLWGYVGMWTFGHAAFFGAGGYASAILIMNYGLTNFWVNLLLAVLFTVVLAAILGVAALRVFPVGAIANPVYFILATLAFGEILSRIAITARGVTGGSTGLAGIPFPEGVGFSIDSASFYYLVFGFAAVCIYVMYRIVCSRYGFALRGVQGNERRMQALGFNTWVFKYTAWIIAAAFAGVAGVLYSYWGGVLTPSNLGMNTSTIVYLAVVLGGMSIFFGPVLGVVIYVGLYYIASLYLPDRWPLIMGAVFVLSILLMRQGAGVPLLKAWQRLMELLFPRKEAASSSLKQQEGG